MTLTVLRCVLALAALGMRLSKRAVLSQFSDFCGICSILEKSACKSGLAILNLHRIAVAGDCPYDRDVIEASPSQFHDQLAALRRRYHVTDLDEVRAMVEPPRLLRGFHVLLTFDDGYRCNVDVALPILRSVGVRATFFLPTSFIGTGRIPWWDQMAYMIRNTRKSALTLRHPREHTVPLPAGDRREAIRGVLRLYKESAGADAAQLLRDVEEQCEVALPLAAGDRLFMTWQEAALLSEAGMGIGSHSHTHELLGRQTPAQQAEECHLSRRILEERLGIKVDALAYPVGSIKSFTTVTMECLRAAGYRLAFSFYGGVNAPDTLQRFNLLRMGLYSDMHPSELRMRMAVAATLGKQLW